MMELLQYNTAEEVVPAEENDQEGVTDAKYLEKKKGFLKEIDAMSDYLLDQVKVRKKEMANLLQQWKDLAPTDKERVDKIKEMQAQHFHEIKIKNE